MGIIAVAGLFYVAEAELKDNVAFYAGEKLKDADVLPKAAEFLGQDETVLRKELDSGKTLGQIIESKNISETELKLKAKSELESFLSLKVRNGEMSQQTRDNVVRRFDGLYDRYIDYILSLDATELSKLGIPR